MTFAVFRWQKYCKMMIFLSLHTRNVNPPAKNVNPLEKSHSFRGWG